jgi:tartrate-resistant acid phosphatase type 5
MAELEGRPLVDGTPSSSEPLHLEDAAGERGAAGGSAARRAWSGAPRGAGAAAAAAALGALLLLAAATVGYAGSAGGGAAGADDVSFLVIGDWGRRWSANASAVAALMGEVAEGRGGIDFVVSVGDNFYPAGLNSTEDPQFDAVFKNVYTHPALQVPWHVALGCAPPLAPLRFLFPEVSPPSTQAPNSSLPPSTHLPRSNHDYGDGVPYCGPDGHAPCARGPLHQLSPALVARDARWHCERGFSVAAGGREGAPAVELFFLDTSPIAYDAASPAVAYWAKYDGGLATQSGAAALAELAAHLAASRARTKLVVGHHPTRSNGASHGDSPRLAASLEPLLAAHRVRAYFAGHDHGLEHIAAPPGGGAAHVFVSGAGSADDSPGFSGARWGSTFQHRRPGFLAVRVRGGELLAEFFTTDGGSAAPTHSAALAPL